MGPKQHNLYSKPEYINSQHASFLRQYPSQHGSFCCNIHHNLVHFTARYTTTWLILLQYHNMLHFTTIPITTSFILLQHASFYCNMLHFTATSTTTCFILLEHASLGRHSAETGLKSNQHIQHFTIMLLFVACFLCVGIHITIAYYINLCLLVST